MPAVVTRSSLAIQAAQQWNAEDRPAAWIPVFGAFTHTTGGGLPLKAEATKRDPLVLATEVYNKTHGCNYVIGWAGLAGGPAGSASPPVPATSGTRSRRALEPGRRTCRRRS
jgi:hypothetical protein